MKQKAQNPVEMQRAGWQAIMDNFKKYTEANCELKDEPNLSEQNL
ncbi:MAG: hypothetical protein WDM90_19195 [Ferruginibacter sp.]